MAYLHPDKIQSVASALVARRRAGAPRLIGPPAINPGPAPSSGPRLIGPPVYNPQPAPQQDALRDQAAALAAQFASSPPAQDEESLVGRLTAQFAAAQKPLRRIL